MAENLERQELGKAMGLFDFFTLGFGAMVGVGWVVTVGSWIANAGGPLGAIIAFAIGGLMLLPITYAYGEMTASMPVAGGEIAYTYRAFGSTASFYTGWVLCFGYAFLCPWEAVAIGRLVGSLLPVMKVIPIYEVMGFTVYLPLLILDLVVAGAIIWMNVLGVDKVAKFQSGMTNFLLACSAIFIITGFIKGSFANAQPWIGHSLKGFSTLGGIVAVLAITPFFFAGFDTIPQGAEESSEGMDYNSLGKVLSLAVGAGVVFYALAILSVSMVMPWKELVNLEFPAADAMMTIAPIVGRIVLLGALGGLLTTFNAFFVASTRVLFGMGRARLLPQWFGKIDDKYKTPINANIFVGVLTIVAPFIGTAILLPIVDVGSLCFMLAWLLVSASAISMRKNKPNMPRPYQMPGGITTGYIAVLMAIIFTLVLVVPGSPGALVWPLEWIVFGAWLILGIIFYYLAKPGRESITEKEREYLIFGDWALNED